MPSVKRRSESNRVGMRTARDTPAQTVCPVAGVQRSRTVRLELDAGVVVVFELGAEDQVKRPGTS